jgi:hypothetical protein
LTPELAEAVAGASEVYFVDASADPRQESVQLNQITGGPTPSVLGHVSQPQEVIALAAAVFGKVPKAWLLTVPAESFELGAPLSAFAEHGVKLALGILSRRCDGTRQVLSKWQNAA